MPPNPFRNCGKYKYSPSSRHMVQIIDESEINTEHSRSVSKSQSSNVMRRVSQCSACSGKKSSNFGRAHKLNTKRFRKILVGMRFLCSPLQIGHNHLEYHPGTRIWWLPWETRKHCRAREKKKLTDLRMLQLIVSTYKWTIETTLTRNHLGRLGRRLTLARGQSGNGKRNRWPN